MVLSQRHSSLPRAQTAPLRLDPGRIAGMAAAMTLNIAALMLLLVPVSAPMPQIRIDDSDRVIKWVEYEKPKPKPEPIPVFEKIKPATNDAKPKIVQSQPTPQTVATQTDIAVPDGTEYVEPQPVDTTIEPTEIGTPIEPQAASSLEYAAAPPPTYPRDALMDGLQGTVYLKVLVDVDGKPLSVEIQRSSGHRKLDDAAKRQVLKKWKFRPAMQNGQAIQVYGIVPVHFSLERQ
mgnify:FL=1